MKSAPTRIRQCLFAIIRDHPYSTKSELLRMTTEQMAAKGVEVWPQTWGIQLTRLMEEGDVIRLDPARPDRDFRYDRSARHTYTLSEAAELRCLERARVRLAASRTEWDVA